MANLGRACVLFSLFLTYNMSLFITTIGAFAKEWSGSSESGHVLGMGKERITKLHFFFRDILSGKKPSAMRVAQAITTNKSPTLFGAVMMADDLLTEGPEATLPEVGRAQGMYGSAGQRRVSLIMAMSFTFTKGKYKGSSISILSRNPALNPVREMAVVGGTGLFRLARGSVAARTQPPRGMLLWSIM